LALDSEDEKFEMELVVERGRGYSPAEERGKLPIGEIPLSAVFSPVLKVNFSTERERVGQMTNFDRLIVEIWTDGTISPRKALTASAQILVKHFSLISGLEEVPLEFEEAAEEKAIPAKIYEVPIEELQLSVRAFNCLRRAGIAKVGEILERLEEGEQEMLNSIRGFGRKSLDELYERLEAKGFLVREESEEEVSEDGED